MTSSTATKQKIAVWSEDSFRSIIAKHYSRRKRLRFKQQNSTNAVTFRTLNHENNMPITPQQFFNDFFPQTYICAMSQGGGQFEGQLVDHNTDLSKMIKTYQDLNISRHNIYFTPNGAKTAEGKNRLDNLAKINAWWIDIDIDESKHADDEETLKLRERKKAEIRGYVFGVADCPVWPSLMVETRNGFQLYWFAAGETNKDTWMTIGLSIYEHFRAVGSDKSTVKVMQLMRVPNFCYIKNGEVGKIEIFPLLSTLRRHSQDEMLQSFPPVIQKQEELDLKIDPKIYKPIYKQEDEDKHDIFLKVVQMPLDEVLAKLSGHWLVNGEKLTLQKLDTVKSNILVDGKVSPNFIIRTSNHIFSNNAEVKGPTIVQYLSWYQNRKSIIAKGLKELFPIS